MTNESIPAIARGLSEADDALMERCAAFTEEAARDLRRHAHYREFNPNASMSATERLLATSLLHIRDLADALAAQAGEG